MREEIQLKRSSRLIDLTIYFNNHPNVRTPLTYFSERFSAAKSSISEDLAILKKYYEQENIGELITISGVTGGVVFIPRDSKEMVKRNLDKMITEIQSKNRLLPGGYLYISDIISSPHHVRTIGSALASAFQDEKIDVIMTIATKGIPIAYAIASFINVPVICVRQSLEVTEGSMVTIYYESGSKNTLYSMGLSRHALQKGQRVLVVDDLLKVGGTIRGMAQIVQEFEAELVGIGVFIESSGHPRIQEDYVSLIKYDENIIKDNQPFLTYGNIGSYLKN